MNFKYSFLFFFIHIGLFGQQEVKIDSIHQLYSTYQNKDLLKALKYAEQAVQLSEVNEVDSLKLVSYKNYIEILYKVRKIELAEKINLKMMDLAQKNNNEKYLSLCYYHSSNLNMIKRNYDKSLMDIEKALSVAYSNNFIDVQHKALNRKVFLFRNTKNDKKALDLVRSVLNNKSFKDVNDLAMSYCFLGELYFQFLQKKDSSLYFYKKGISLVETTNNVYIKTILTFNYGDKLLQTENKLEGLKYLGLAEKSAIKSNNFRLLYSIISSLGIYHHDNKEYSEAIKKYKEAEEKYGTYTSKEYIADLYWRLSEVLFLNNEPKEAYLYQEKLLLLNDRLFTIKKNNTFEKLQTEYEVEKKNNQISFLEKEQILEAKQKKLVLGIGGLLLTVLGLLAFVYKNKVRSERLIREKEQKLHEQEKEQLEQTQKIQRIEGFIQGEEKEKNRIAVELHDGIGGKLAGVKHLVSALQATKDTSLLAENITHITKEVRLLSHSLSYTYSLQKPLKHLLEELQEQYENHFTIEVILYPENEIAAIKDDKKLFIYRSIQELVNNCYKYAKATNLSISLTATDELLLMVEDDGVGFNTASSSNGIGLQNIREKLIKFNGELHIDTVINRGTTIIIKLPK